jgi:glyoxylase I family protein
MNPLQFEQIHHGSLVVADLERAARFYTQVLGLREIPTPATFVPAGLRVRWFQLGTQQLHVIQGTEPNPPSARHLALQVADAAAARDHLRAGGLELQEAVAIPGADRFFVTDPDGNLLEIIEWQTPYRPVSPEDLPG